MKKHRLPLSALMLILDGAGGLGADAFAIRSAEERQLSKLLGKNLVDGHSVLGAIVPHLSGGRSDRLSSSSSGVAAKPSFFLGKLLRTRATSLCVEDEIVDVLGQEQRRWYRTTVYSETHLRRHRESLTPPTVTDLLAQLHVRFAQRLARGLLLPILDRTRSNWP
jgi:hypothetical protein